MIIKNINITKLHQEFEDAGVNANYALALPNEDNEFDFEKGTDMTLVQRIIDAHDSTPLPTSLSETEKIRLEMARANAEMFETMLSLIGGM
ncbi:hypothetical protein ACTHOQ_13905 [Solibacillus silvestris]|uniref:hypothetical protein n=1 Tax=Solibacillus silvestris TaxID=76853 RepID=UPI003F7CE611